MKIEGRASTLSEKKAVLVGLYQVWKQNPELRLGQLLQNAFERNSRMNYVTGETLHIMDIFSIEDFPFVEALKKYYEPQHLPN